MINVSIYKIDKTVFEGEADSVTLPGADGELGILENHIPLVASLKEGSVVIRNKKETLSVAIAGGFAEVRPEGELVVLAN